jgi:Ca2+-binding EF-hand superfamily protein
MFRKTLVMYATIAATVVALVGSAAAQASDSTGPRHARMMERVDTDKDGKISREEYLKAAEQRFAGLDANKDGYVTQDEFRAGREAMRARHHGDRANPKE